MIFALLGAIKTYVLSFIFLLFLIFSNYHVHKFLIFLSSIQVGSNLGFLLLEFGIPSQHFPAQAFLHLQLQISLPFLQFCSLSAACIIIFTSIMLLRVAITWCFRALTFIIFQLVPDLDVLNLRFHLLSLLIIKDVLFKRLFPMWCNIKLFNGVLIHLRCFIIINSTCV